MARGKRYRLFGGEKVPLTFSQVEEMIRGGLLRLETKAFRDTEGFAVALSARAEFQHLLDRDMAAPEAPGEPRAPTRAEIDDTEGAPDDSPEILSTD